MKEEKAVQLNALTMAFLGDAVFSLYVREYAVNHMDVKPNEINKYCIRFVRASAQAKAYDAIEGDLTEEELAVAHRARNAHPANKAKNASLGEYMHATAFEAVLGYLHITEKKDRLDWIQKKAMEVINNEQG